MWETYFYRGFVTAAMVLIFAAGLESWMSALSEESPAMDIDNGRSLDDIRGNFPQATAYVQLRR